MRMKERYKENGMKAIISIAALALLAGSASAQVWDEQGDAGQNGVNEGQVTIGQGPLQEIRGRIGSNTDVDLYCIRIVDRDGFLATTVNGANFDTQLFLFGSAGEPWVENDDFGGGLQSAINSDAPFQNGRFYLAISSFNTDPLDVNNADPFGFDEWPPGGRGQRRPVDGAGALASWDSAGSSAGAYTIFLRGAEFCEIPAPGAAALLGLGGLTVARRRRA